MAFDQFVFKRLLPTIFSRPLMQPINQLLLRIALSGMGVNNYNGSSLDEERFLRRLSLPNDSVILDVGANHGQYAALARRHFPSSAIYSFEPNPASFKELQKVARSLNITAIPKGCGDQPGTLTLFDTAADAASGLATFVPGVFEYDGVKPVAIQAQVTTIDDFCELQGISNVGLIKIDVEGFEAKVLAGAQRTLHNTSYVQFEFNEMNLLSKTTMLDLEKLLPEFELHRLLYDGSLLPIDLVPIYRKNLFAYQNVIAVRRRQATKEPSSS